MYTTIRIPGLLKQRLDEMIKLQAEVDEGSAGLSEAGQTVMGIWDKMDRGVLTDKGEAFDEADRRVREKQKAPEEA